MCPRHRPTRRNWPRDGVVGYLQLALAVLVSSSFVGLVMMMMAYLLRGLAG